MAVVAEPALDLIDDRLAARNALVLAVAQALAGGNNTVIVATTSIIGSMLAPDPALATLPISVMVAGMWMGTIPVGMLAKAYGRRFAVQTGSAFGVLSGLISCAAVLHGSFWLLLVGTLCGGLYAAAHQSYRFAATDTASPQFRPKAVAWVLAGGIFAAVIGSQLVIFTKDAWPPYLFAGTFLAQSACAVLAAIVLAQLKIPAAAGVAFVDRRASAQRHRRAAEIPHRRRLRPGQLFDDEHGDDVGAAGHGHVQSHRRRGGARHPMACHRHVRAELHHRFFDRPLRRARA